MLILLQPICSASGNRHTQTVTDVLSHASWTATNVLRLGQLICPGCNRYAHIGCGISVVCDAYQSYVQNERYVISNWFRKNPRLRVCRLLPICTLTTDMRGIATAACQQQLRAVNGAMSGSSRLRQIGSQAILDGISGLLQVGCAHVGCNRTLAAAYCSFCT